MHRVDVVDAERGERDPVGDERVLERLGRRVLVRLEQELDAVGHVGTDDGQPSELADRDVGLGLEAEDVGVERQGLGLVVDEDAGGGDARHTGSPCWARIVQVSGHRSVRARSGVVSRWWKLGATVAARGDQAGLLEDREVLRDGLTARGDPVPHGQARAELEQRLAVAVGQLVEDHPAGLVGKSLEQQTGPVVHGSTIGKYPLAYQVRDRLRSSWGTTCARSRTSTARPARCRSARRTRRGRSRATRNAPVTPSPTLRRRGRRGRAADEQPEHVDAGEDDVGHEGHRVEASRWSGRRGGTTARTRPRTRPGSRRRASRGAAPT